MAIDREAQDLKQLGDALDGVAPRVVELLGVVGLVALSSLYCSMMGWPWASVRPYVIR